MVSYMDYVLGRLMDALEQRQMLDSTIIVVTLDHGDWAGNRGLLERHHNALDDHMLGVPLLISAPGMGRGPKVNGQVELFDILPTVLELTDTTRNHVHFALSLLPELHGERDDLNRRIFAEGGYGAIEHERNRIAYTKDGVIVREDPYYRMVILSRQYPSTMCRGVCVRTPGYKLIRRENGEPELYSLADDPREINNLYADGGHDSVRRQLEDMLLMWLIRTGDAAPAGRDSRGLGQVGVGP